MSGALKTSTRTSEESKCRLRASTRVPAFPDEPCLTTTADLAGCASSSATDNPVRFEEPVVPAEGAL